MPKVAATVAVFDRPLFLAAILDNAADELDRSWFGYEWNDRTRCNCGIVARHVLQTSPAKLRKLLPPVYDRGVFCCTWRGMTENQCPDGGLPQNEVFARLLEAGLQRNDFAHLEDLSHPAIVARMERSALRERPISRTRKADVSAYLRSWSRGIEQSHDKGRMRDLEPAAEALVGE